MWPAPGRLPIEEVQALVAEITSRVVVDEIENDGEPVKVCQIDERLQLVHLAPEVFDPVACDAPGIEQVVDRLRI